MMAAICDGIGRMGGSKGRAIPCVVGADVNMPPEECVKASALGDAGLQVVSPSTPRGTFRTRTSARCIDYFLVSGCMTDLIRRVGTVEGSGIAGHVPVTLEFKPRATAQKALVLRAPPPLPGERVYGPLPAPPTYSNAMRLAKLAVRAAERREDGETQQYWLDAAYAAFANDLEEEMCGVTGATIEAKGKRGRGPSLVWRSILPEAPPEIEKCKAADDIELRGVAREIAAVEWAREQRLRDERPQPHEHAGHETAGRPASTGEAPCRALHRSDHDEWEKQVAKAARTRRSGEGNWRE